MDIKEINELFEKAAQVRDNAYAPYSKFKVGAALKTNKGNIFLGCNVENAAYDSTLCAERNAITTAIAVEGTQMKIQVIAIVVGECKLASPCGACRQVIAEFSNYNKDEETLVAFNTNTGMEVKKISEILPYRFEF
jgi:cytidine deaminase